MMDVAHLNHFSGMGSDSDLMTEDMDLNYSGEMEEQEQALIVSGEEESVLYSGPVFEGAKENNFFHNPKLTIAKGNIVNPVKGFDEEEKRICPLVDRKSAILFDIVQRLEEEHFDESIRILKKYGKGIIFPKEFLDEEGGSSVAIKVCDELPSKQDEELIIELELEEARKQLGDPDEVVKTYSPPFEHGWTREVVLRIHTKPPEAEGGEHPLTSIGEVFYRDPDGNKIRSMKQIALILEKNPLPGVSIRNFTFAKGPVGVNDPKKEIIRRINSGRLPVIATPRAAGLGKLPRKPISMTSEMARNGSFSDHPMSAKSKGSSSRRSIQPPKRYSTGQQYMYPEKRSKTGMRKDIDYPLEHEMEMGMLPPKYRDLMSGGNSSDGDDSVAKFRRGRQSMKKNPLHEDFEGSFNGGNDSALFQISAFHNNSQSSLFESFDDDNSDRMYDTLSMMPSQESDEFEDQALSQEDSAELLPCSIRCPGMTGEVPTLQCIRCLCLYHPECLQLPGNQSYRNFLCANCEGEPSPPRLSPSLHTKARSMGQGSKLKAGWPPNKLNESINKSKKPPPPLLPAFSKFGKMQGLNLKSKLNPPKLSMPPNTGRGIPQVQSKRSSLAKFGAVSAVRSSGDSMTISPVSFKRNKGSQGKDMKPLPNLSGRNLTITPISMKPRLPLPNLAPMAKGKPPQLPIAPPKLKTTQAIQQQLPRVSVSPGKGRPSLPPLKRGGSPGIKLTNSLLKDVKDLKPLKSIISSPASLFSKGPGGFPMFKRYPQSIVSIGTKKFVAVPRGTNIQPLNSIKKQNTSKIAVPTDEQTSEVKKEADENTGDEKIENSTPHRFGTEQIVIEKVFRYLNVKDLLRASRVCRLWNIVSTDAKLVRLIGFGIRMWKVLKMKNHRISDIEAFADFLQKQCTEVVDFRKMISAEEMDWEKLFGLLSDVKSLRQIVLGPRTLTPERSAELSQLCPSVEVVTS